MYCASSSWPVFCPCLLLFQYWIDGYNLTPNFETFKEPKNRFQGTDSARLCSLAGRYDNPIPTRFLAPIDCLTIPALSSSLCLYYFYLYIHLWPTNERNSLSSYQQQIFRLRYLAIHRGGEWDCIKRGGGWHLRFFSHGGKICIGVASAHAQFCIHA